MVSVFARSDICFVLLLVTLASVPVPSFAQGWPMLGRTAKRNPVVPQGEAPTKWDVESGKNIKWTAQLGSVTWTSPVVSDGRIYVGTNNGAGYLERYPADIDLGCLLCFEEKTGAFLWQYSTKKLPIGRVHDWPMQGIGSSPLVDGQRMWFVDNRWQVICADTRGFHDGQNDGPFLDEEATGPREADVIWKLDLINKLGIHPHTAGMGPDRRPSIVNYGECLYAVTGNGIAEDHLNLPTPQAPSLVCLDRSTGKVLWTDNSPGTNILHGQWADPLVAEIDGRAQVIAPQGDGWIRSFDAKTGKLIWKFDMNEKESKWRLGGGNRNNLLATPVLYNKRVYVASGQCREHGSGPGRLVCLDPTKSGDISVELAMDEDGEQLAHRRVQAVDPEKGEKAVSNPNSGLLWEFGAETEKEFEETMHRTVASVAVHEGVVIAVDMEGLVHCLDAKTGKQYWAYDTFALIVAAPLIVDDKIFVADEDDKITVLRLSTAKNAANPLEEHWMDSSLYASPIFANDTLYITTRSKLYAIAVEAQKK